VVLQEVSADTDTAAHADLLLPAAGWGEKEGTVTNSERRISRVHAAVPAPGEARADWRIVVDFAHRLESRLSQYGDTLFPYANTEEHLQRAPRHDRRPRPRHRRPLLRPAGDPGPQQWPLRAGAAFGTPRLYADGVFPTASGRARFKATQHRRWPKPPTRAIRCISTPAACATSGTA
jgi:assimilatory nitrate reductase catalytic subunit